MRKKDPKQESLLQITVVMRPAGGGKLPPGPEWLARCQKIHATLRAYLISKA